LTSKSISGNIHSNNKAGKMIDQSAARILHPLEVRIILAFDEGEIIDSQRVKQVLGFREGQEQQGFFLGFLPKGA